MSVRVRASLLSGTLLLLSLAGCGPQGSKTGPTVTADATRSREFGEFELPRKVGYVFNLGLQLPVVSPDGTQMLYLRTDLDAISPLTLVGSMSPQDTPAEGTLSIWIRPIHGESLGRRVSRGRWAHSAAWSPSGQYMAYIACEEGRSYVVRRNLGSGKEDVLGDGGVCCLPAFDGNDDTLLFSRAETPGGSLRACRQRVGAASPEVLTPDGADCLPVLISEGNRVVCGRVEQDRFGWVECSSAAARELTPACGPGERLAAVQSLAGISVPVCCKRDSFLFYDAGQDRVAACRPSRRVVRRHRPGTIAACWLGDDTIALATAEGLFAVKAESGMSASLLSGSWLPLRYVPTTGTLLLLGRENGTSRLPIYELVFRPARLDAQQ